MPSAGGTIAAPDAPANLTASNGPGRKKISLSWDASSGATSYNVYRSDSSSGSFSNIATGVTSTGYSNTGLANGSTWWYYVTAVNSGGESGSSNVVSGTAK
jgi:cellulose 1,4-beta-cellobiosidase